MDQGRSAAVVASVRAAVERVVLGQQAAVAECLVALAARGHVLLEGVPGTAKTLLVRAFARALGVGFGRIQFTPDLMPGDITGIAVLTERQQLVFRPGPVFRDLLLADEVNRAPAKTQAALLEAMQERTVTVDGTTHPLPEPFTVFATQNPVEYEGTYPLPEAELDRFLLKVLMPYPEESAEQGVLRRHLGGFDPDTPGTFGMEPVVDAAGLAALRTACRAIRADDRIVTYVTSVARATRSSASLALGASPRAAVALLRAAQGWALLEGRDFVVPDDVKRMALPVLRHRVVVAPELELEGVHADQAIGALLEQVDVPAE